ncbi:MAG: PilN domain-containing protein [bacterium]|nr:PilN domain-containing protein [bacterium]
MPKKEINLIPREDFEKQPLGKFLIWALSVGRWIVIATELVVILAFLSRFKLDRDIADLYETIRTKQAIAQSSSAFEKEFRLFQSRIKGTETLVSNHVNPVSIIDQIAASTPVDVTIKSIAYEKQNVKIDGLSLSERGLQDFITSLSSSTFFTDTNVENLAKYAETGGGVRFTVTAAVKGEKK